MAINPNKLFIRVGAGSVKNGQVTVQQVLEKSAEPANNTKVFFIADTNQIVVGGVAYGLSADTAAEITKIKSILKTYFADGAEDNVKAAIDAVKAELDAYKPVIESKAFGSAAYDAASKSIKFTHVDGSDAGSVLASDIIGNHVVKASEYNPDTNFLKLTFEGAATDAVVNIDLGKMLDMNDVISGDTTHFTASYAEKKLTLTPVVGALAGDKATAGLADATEARAYVDAAIAAANTALDEYKTATDARLDKLEGDGEGSVAKALADAKAYTDAETDRAKAAEKKVADDLAAETTRAEGKEGDLETAINGEVTRAKQAESDLTDALGDEVKRADAAEKANAADIATINKALESADTFWENYENI